METGKLEIQETGEASMEFRAQSICFRKLARPPTYRGADEAAVADRHDGETGERELCQDLRCAGTAPRRGREYSRIKRGFSPDLRRAIVWRKQGGS